MTRNRVTIIALSSLLARLLVTVWPSFDIGTGASDKGGALDRAAGKLVATFFK